MTHPDYLSTWERAAEPLPGRPGVQAHDRGGMLAPPTPAARMAELTNHVVELRGYLAEACAEVRRLRKADARWHTMTNSSFGGIPCAQIIADFLLWETLLNETQELRGIVEIGTWQGGFSLWLQAQARARALLFKTMDSVVHFNDSTGWLLEDGGSGAYPGQIPDFWRVDVFAETEHVGKSLQEWEPVVLFCDGGNKPRELATFAPYLTDPRSLIVVHDWGTEMLPADVPETVEEVYGDFCDELGSISRVFRVKR